MAVNSLNIATLGIWHVDSIGLAQLGLWSPDGVIPPSPPPPSAHRTNDGGPPYLQRPRIRRVSLADQWLKRRKIAAMLAVLIDG